LQAIRYHLDEDFILMNDLDSTTAGYTGLASPTANRGKGWEPIGTALEPFAGNFDGQGYEIRDLFIDRPDRDKLDWNIGLFGCTNNKGTIKNVGVVNTYIVGWWCVGGLVGNNWGTVSNSYSTGSVTGDSRVGGLVGWNEGTVSTSFWDTETSGQATSDGGTGKTTAEMQDIVTFSGATWDIIAVANPSIHNLAYIWNIVNNVTYPFLSWQPVS
jgi:hypothetical protein